MLVGCDKFGEWLQRRQGAIALPRAMAQLIGATSSQTFLLPTTTTDHYCQPPLGGLLSLSYLLPRDNTQYETWREIGRGDMIVPDTTTAAGLARALATSMHAGETALAQDHHAAVRAAHDAAHQHILARLRVLEGRTNPTAQNRDVGGRRHARARGTTTVAGVEVGGGTARERRGGVQGRGRRPARPLTRGNTDGLSGRRLRRRSGAGVGTGRRRRARRTRRYVQNISLHTIPH